MQHPARSNAAASAMLVAALAFAVAPLTASARPAAGGGTRAGGGNVRASGPSNISDNGARNNGNHVNTGNVHVGNNNVNVNVNGGGHDCCGYGWNDYHPVARAAAVGVVVGATAAVTAAALGARYYTLPPACSPYLGSYYYCGGVYYQPQYQGSTVTYVVVSRPG